MTDWNKLTMEQYIEHLEEKFKFDSSGTAKAVFELINAYKVLSIDSVSQQRELLVDFWMNLPNTNKNNGVAKHYVDKYLESTNYS